MILKSTIKFMVKQELHSFLFLFFCLKRIKDILF